MKKQFLLLLVVNVGAGQLTGASYSGASAAPAAKLEPDFSQAYADMNIWDEEDIRTYNNVQELLKRDFTRDRNKTVQDIEEKYRKKQESINNELFSSPERKANLEKLRKIFAFYNSVAKNPADFNKIQRSLDDGMPLSFTSGSMTFGLLPYFMMGIRTLCESVKAGKITDLTTIQPGLVRSFQLLMERGADPQGAYFIVQTSTTGNSSPLLFGSFIEHIKLFNTNLFFNSLKDTVQWMITYLEGLQKQEEARKGQEKEKLQEDSFRKRDAAQVEAGTMHENRAFFNAIQRQPLDVDYIQKNLAGKQLVHPDQDQKGTTFGYHNVLYYFLKGLEDRVVQDVKYLGSDVLPSFKALVDAGASIAMPESLVKNARGEGERRPSFSDQFKDFYEKYVATSGPEIRRNYQQIVDYIKESKRKRRDGMAAEEAKQRAFIEGCLATNPARILRLGDHMQSAQTLIFINPYDTKGIVEGLVKIKGVSLGQSLFDDFITNVENSDIKQFGSVIGVFPVATLQFLVYEGLDPFKPGIRHVSYHRDHNDVVAVPSLYEQIMQRLAWAGITPTMKEKYQQVKTFLDGLLEGKQIAEQAQRDEQARLRAIEQERVQRERLEQQVEAQRIEQVRVVAEQRAQKDREAEREKAKADREDKQKQVEAKRVADLAAIKGRTATAVAVKKPVVQSPSLVPSAKPGDKKGPAYVPPAFKPTLPSQQAAKKVVIPSLPVLAKAPVVKESSSVAGVVIPQARPLARVGAVKTRPGLTSRGAVPAKQSAPVVPTSVTAASAEEPEAPALEDTLQEQPDLQSLAQIRELMALLQVYQEAQQSGEGESAEQLRKSQELFEKMKAFGSLQNLEQVLQANLPPEIREASVESAKKYWEQLSQQEALAQARASNDDDAGAAGPDVGEYTTLAGNDDDEAREQAELAEEQARTTAEQEILAEEQEALELAEEAAAAGGDED